MVIHVRCWRGGCDVPTPSFGRNIASCWLTLCVGVRGVNDAPMSSTEAFRKEPKWRVISIHIEWAIDGTHWSRTLHCRLNRLYSWKRRRCSVLRLMCNTRLLITHPNQWVRNSAKHRKVWERQWYRIVGKSTTTTREPESCQKMMMLGFIGWLVSHLFETWELQLPSTGENWVLRFEILMLLRMLMSTGVKRACKGNDEFSIAKSKQQVAKQTIEEKAEDQWITTRLIRNKLIRLTNSENEEQEMSHKKWVPKLGQE